MNRRLIVHLGMGKTGSSALQVAFVRNRAQLASHGVRYPAHYTDARALQGGTVSGNGLTLMPLLAPAPEMTEEQAQQALTTVLAEVDGSTEPTIVYSSEMLYYFRADRLTELRDALASRGVELWSLMYVRDIAGLVLSSYAQMVKRMLYTEPLSEYVRAYGNLDPQMGVGVRLQTLHDVLGPDRVLVRHYDTERKHLFDSVATEVLGIDDLSDFDVVHSAINRSLSPREVEWMRHMNVELETEEAAGFASDALISRATLDHSASAISREDLEVLRQRFQDEIDWVNKHHFPDSRLSLEGTVAVTDSPIVPELTEEERYLVDTIGELAEVAVKLRLGRRARRRNAAPVTPPPADARIRTRMRRVAGRIRRRLARAS